MHTRIRSEVPVDPLHKVHPRVREVVRIEPWISDSGLESPFRKTRLGVNEDRGTLLRRVRNEEVSWVCWMWSEVW
jgi:hypothetical protein